MKKKKCTKYKQVKELEYFGNWKCSPDGHHPSCLDCQKQYRETKKIKEGKYWLKNKCIDCQCAISPDAYCIDCNSKLRWKDGIRCNKCRNKYLSELAQQKKLNKNSNWKGGISFKPYTIEFTKELKTQIRERDNFTCQNPKCRCKEEDHFLGNLKKNLTIHHINYDKSNNTITNLITLCQTCNSKANGDRDYWYAYYTYLMENFILCQSSVE